MSSTTQIGLYSDAERAYQSGNLARAEKFCRLNLKYQPDDRSTKILLAIVIAKKGEAEEAIPILEEVVLEKPSYEAHLGLATILLFTGNLDEAVIHAEAAIQMAPRELGTYNKFGMELVQRGLAEKAVGYFRRACEFAPNDVSSAQNLAAALKDAGQMRESLAAWKKVTELAPNYGHAWLNLGLLELAAQDLEAALSAGMKAVASDPNSVESQMLVGLAFSEMGRATDATARFRTVLNLDPNHALAQASLGIALYEQGQFDQGIKWLQVSLERWKTNGLAYYTQARSRKITTADAPMIESLETLLQRSDFSLVDRSYMEYALGKAYEDLKDYGTSIAHYDAANNAAYEFWMQENPWNRDRYEATINHTIATFSKDRVEDLKKLGLASDLPVFIVGMIRSGTTLVEQILSSHPSVAGAGELTYWHEQAVKCFNADDDAVDVEKLTEIATGYLELLKESGPKAHRVTDKLPHNYAVLGLIQPALPNARIIHIRRNPIDNCLSVYTTAYARPPGFTLKRENIIFAYQEYQRLVAHWRQTLPEDRFLEIDYEDLIANRETVARKMINFIGLEWSDRCLHHEENKRIVHTPSAWQVRQPLYTTSIERWRKFEPWIAPFDELLKAN